MIAWLLCDVVVVVVVVVSEQESGTWKEPSTFQSSSDARSLPACDELIATGATTAPNG